MLLFNVLVYDSIFSICNISKHHMLLFNLSCMDRFLHLRQISKHHMLLFNKVKNKLIIIGGIFQNIICYCLTIPITGMHGFPRKFQNIICYCLTIEKTSFFNFFFQKKNDFMGFSNIFTNRPIKFNLS